jgi:CubicO group peptidase (beta-lactamase class C family)
MTHSKPQPVFPADEWETCSPESQGIDSARLALAMAALAEGCGSDGVEETVLIRNGYLVHQGMRSRNKHNIWSCTKSFVSTALAVLIADGLCALDQAAADFEPVLQDQYPGITLRHFATMTSGYQAAGANRWGQDSRDWSTQPFVPARPLFAPGTSFAYWDNAMNMFGRVLVQIAHRDLKSLLEERITDPIGMGAWNWSSEFDLNGIPIHYASTGIEVNPHQLARLGWLYIHRGNWNGRQLVDPEWAKQATCPQVPSDLTLAPTDRSSIDGRGVYGYNWWTNQTRSGGQSVFPHAPTGVFYALGLNNNRCIAVPEWNLVFVRMGQDERQDDSAYDRFFALLGEAISSTSAIDHEAGYANH